MKRSLSQLVLPLLGLALGGLGYYHVRQESRTAPLATPPERPARSPYEESVAAVGLVEPRTENIAVGTALDGVVLEVHVPSDRAGTRVSAGTPLFRVDDRHLKAQLAVAEAQLASAQARLTKLERYPRPEELPPSLARLEAARARVDRARDPYERARRIPTAIAREQHVALQRDYEVAVQELAQAQAEHDLLRAGAWGPDIEIARAAVVEARSQVARVRTEIARAVVVAPVDGVVLQVNVRRGERVSERDGRALMVLGDTGTCHVRVDVDERDIARFQPGAAATGYPRGATGRGMRLRFVRVEPLVIPKKSLTGESTERIDTRVLQVVYAIDRADHPVYVGQQIDVFIARDTASNARASR